MFLLCFYLIIEQWTHLTREFEQRIYTSISVVILSILEVPKIISIGKKCGILKFTILFIWGLFTSLIQVRTVSVHCTVMKVKQRLTSISTVFFLKILQTKTGSFKTQICPKVESPTSPFWNWPPSQNVTVDNFQNTSIPSSKTFLATTTW